MQSEQREKLLAAKLTGLVRAATGAGALSRYDEPQNRGAVTTLTNGTQSFGLIETGAPGPVASAAIWAKREGSQSLTLFVDSGAAETARFASYFTVHGPSISVLRVEGHSAEPAEPTPVPEPVAAPQAPEDLTAALLAQGLEVIAEHGVVRGEVLGLEVARLVRWPASNGGDDELHLEAGVGRFDRDAVAAVNADVSPRDALAQTVELVRRHRYPGAPVHPLSLLSRERWLRSSLVENPGRVGAEELCPVGMTVEATGMRDPHPAAAYGRGVEGRPLIVVCSTGINMSTVPLAADLRESLDPSADLLIAVPHRDRHASTVELAAMLGGRVDVVGVDVEWG